MEWRFLTDWDAAAEHPTKTAVAAALVTGPVFAALAFWFITDRHLLVSVIVGVLGGLGFALATYSHARLPDRSRAVMYGVERRSVAIVSPLVRWGLLGAGVAILALGVAWSDGSLAISGLLLGLLGAALTFGRRRGRG